jgi:hypothetical protein
MRTSVFNPIYVRTKTYAELLSEHPHASDPDVELEQCAEDGTIVGYIQSHQTDTLGS